ncbi:hypothetical protein FPOAC2_11792 [Fusarium poae]|uniref:hypothetical protein n=1 Tax=Fusarium poae TaxID=36050 RepID=UPI001CE83461|nr:hypothetical protein FPOAC1_011488 [Fusarium poae]KAG8666677.1 hypothetical protein FPOAC1_011488 [Fusarium poae]
MLQYPSSNIFPSPPLSSHHYGQAAQTAPGLITSFGVSKDWRDPNTTKTPLFTTAQPSPNIKRYAKLNGACSKLPMRQHVVDDDLSPLQDHTAGIYCPLLGSERFRLLEVLPGVGDIINARLHVCNVSKNIVAYEALSYTWGGGMVPHKLRVEANREHHMISVSQNLYSALFSLRQATSSRLLWVDAICINQEDMIEKGQQVRMMKTIYSIAHRVVVWLGDDNSYFVDGIKRSPPASEGFSSVCTIVNDWLNRNGEKEIKAAYYKILDNGVSIMRSGKTSNSETSNSYEEFCYHHSSALKLFGRRWFSRVWVFQEAVLARSAIVQLGPYQIEWEWVGLAASIILHNPVVEKSGPERKRVPTGVTNAYLMYRLSASQSYFPPLKFTFTQLLRVTRPFNCKDERDKIYGLIGIQTTDGLNEKIIPDYSKGTGLEQIYQNVAWLLLRSESPLSILSSARMFLHEPEYPSWVPRWGYQQPWTILPVHPHSQFQCALARPSAIIGSDGTEKLVVEGVIVHRIKRVWDTAGYEYLQDSKDDDFLDQPRWINPDWDKQDTKTQEFLSKPRWSEADWEKCALSMTCGGDGRGYAVANVNIHAADLAAAVLSPHRSWLIHNLLAFETTVKSRQDDMTQFDFLTSIAKRGNLNRFINAMAPLHHNYKAFVTDLDFFGVGPVTMREGDMLCVLFGAAVPFVLRRTQGGYKLIGECYAFDLMHGEIFTMMALDSSGWLKPSYITLL